jgi:hypothetical protein
MTLGLAELQPNDYLIQMSATSINRFSDPSIGVLDAGSAADRAFGSKPRN